MEPTTTTVIKKSNIFLKGGIIVLLIFFLMIPTFMINSLVSERMQRQDEAYTEVSSKWANAQTISGPIISIPYFEFVKDTSGKVLKFTKYLRILPDILNINGVINPQTRHRGIYQLVVYSSQFAFSGNFQLNQEDFKNIPKENIQWGSAIAGMGISDLRGIEENVDWRFDNTTSQFSSGSSDEAVFENGISVPVSLSIDDSSAMNFSCQLSLKGSQNIKFAPLGRETQVRLNSGWANPSFDGSFLPDSSNVSEKGFSAYWKILQLNRNYPQTWINNTYDVSSSYFGVNLKLSVDGYTKTDRAIKYAILFISLTFLIFFFLEMLNGKSIHPLQYVLVGFALCIFFILLLAISEYISFNYAYIISAIMTIGLIWWYAKSILQETRLANLIGGNLTILYLFIFTILQLQDFALLMGAFGLFIILAIVMYYSKKIDWSNVKM
ncbi:MAG: cell envelope integrity protein CreD [Chitinophagales bacterium]